MRRQPTRSCVACRTARPKRELRRVVRRPDGSVTIDPTGRAPGRGAYLCDDPACVETAARRGALEHALGVSLPADLMGRLAGVAALATEPQPTIPGAPIPAPTEIPDQMPRGDTHGQE